MTCTDMRENGVREVRLSPFKRGFGVGPPPPSSDNTSLGPPPPPRKIPESKPLCQFYRPFCSIFAVYIYATI